MILPDFVTLHPGYDTAREQAKEGAWYAPYTTGEQVASGTWHYFAFPRRGRFQVLYET